jgi:hypothetical protein
MIVQCVEDHPTRVESEIRMKVCGGDSPVMTLLIVIDHTTIGGGGGFDEGRGMVDPRRGYDDRPPMIDDPRAYRRDLPPPPIYPPPQQPPLPYEGSMRDPRDFRGPPPVSAVEVVSSTDPS